MRVMKGKQFDSILRKIIGSELKNILNSSYAPFNILEDCRKIFKERN
jgi:hypothetical protein